MRELAIEFESSGEPDFVHRVRNFAEALARHETVREFIAVPNMDTATNRVQVTVSAPRHLGAVLGAMQSLLVKHHLAEGAHVIK